MKHGDMRQIKNFEIQLQMLISSIISFENNIVSNILLLITDKGNIVEDITDKIFEEIESLLHNDDGLLSEKLISSLAMVKEKFSQFHDKFEIPAAVL